MYAVSTSFLWHPFNALDVFFFCLSSSCYLSLKVVVNTGVVIVRINVSVNRELNEVSTALVSLQDDIYPPLKDINKTNVLF